MWEKIRPNLTKERFVRTLLGIFCASMVWPLSAHARGLRVAIFDFELIDTSLEGATNGPRADETARLARLGDQLRNLVIESGKLEVIDIAPVRTEAHEASLQACGGCDADFARELGAEVSITGTVQKVSNLILNINLYARVVATREPLVAMSVDIRGNTDESWSRGLEYLVHTRFLPPGNRNAQ
ncbi:MAG TPA: DUF3280 domain-containing protein [Bradyrhizobium sp.]